MRTVAALSCLALVACGSKKQSEPESIADKGGMTKKPSTGDRFAKVKQPKVSAVCEQARGAFGYGAECIETELPELTSPAGTLTRVMQKGDVTAEWGYILTKPDGSMVYGDAGSYGILDTILKSLDARTLPPELLAKLYSELNTQIAVVRCLPGANDTLAKCAAPALAKKGDKVVLTFIEERFPHVRLNRDDHEVHAERITVEEHRLSLDEGSRVLELPADAPLPAGMPPQPTMTTPPAWLAKPVEAPADVSAALCAKAIEQLGIKGRQCTAYAYPSLDLPTGSLFYLANDAGHRHLLGLKKPDGTMVVASDVTNTDNSPLIPLVKNYDPKTVPAEKLVAAMLFLGGEAAHMLCLPGSNDVIPDATCEPPKVEKKGDGLLVSYIIEELPFPDEHGSVSDPAVRSFSTELSPGGGSLGGGTRLVDMRDN